MKETIRDLICAVLDDSDLIEAIEEEIRDRLDYSAIAECILDDLDESVTSMAAEIAAERLS